MVTPLRVEYGVGLKSFIQDRGGSETGSDLDQRYEELSDRIDSQFGVKIPQAQWIARDELPAGSYALMFYERLVVWGEVKPESRFCLNPPAELFKKRYPEFWRTDIPRDPITGKQTGPPLFSPARDPLTGAEGAWIGTGAFESGILGKRQLFDALDFVLRHLEAVVLSKLQDFLSHQEVINRLRGSRRSHVRRIAESPEQVDALVDVLKAKLCKQEPIERFDDLCLDFLFMTR